MAKIKINGDSSGYVEIAAPNAAHNNTLELGPGTKILTDKNNHTGNIGIGTDNPSRKIHINSGSTDTAMLIESTDGDVQINLKDVDSSDGVSIGCDQDDFYVRTGLTAERLRLDSDGNMGLGGAAVVTSTAYNAAAFHLRQSGASKGAQLRMTTQSGSGHTASDGFVLSFWHDNNVYFENRENGSIRFQTNGGERLRINSDGKSYFTGNLGLGGQTSPASSIHINNFGNDGYELKLTGNALQFNRSSNSYIDQLHNSGSILFRMTSSNTEAMRITSDRVVKIPDGGKLTCGTGDDLEIEHTGSGSFIRTSASSSGDLAIESRGTNHDLYLTAADDIYIRPQGGEDGIKVHGNSSVELFYDSAKKLETVSNGTKTTGRIFLNGTNGGFDYNNTAHTLEFLVSNGTTHSELTHNAYVPSASNTRHLGYANKRWATLYVDKIAFGGSANTDQHSLDDYEEGTYTPTYQNFTTTGTSTLVGKYVKVGRQVTVGIKWSCTGTIAHSTSAFVSLPFAMTYGQEYNGLIGMLHNNNGTSQTSGKSGVQCKLDGEGGSRFFPGSFTTTSSGESLLFGGTYIAAS